MKIGEPDRYGHVILSAAKNLCAPREILRCAQNDICEGLCYGNARWKAYSLWSIEPTYTKPLATVGDE